MSKKWLWVQLIAAASCGVESPTLSSTESSVIAIEWEGRDSEVSLLPASHQMQIVITDGWQSQERHVWIVDNGEDVRFVVRCSANEVEDVVASVVNETGRCLVPPSVSVEQTYVVRPPPPPPPPGLEAEFLENYVHDVIEFAREVSTNADKRCTTLVIASLGTGPIPPPPPGPGGIVADAGIGPIPPPPPPGPGGLVAIPSAGGIVNPPSTEPGSGGIVAGIGSIVNPPPPPPWPGGIVADPTTD